MGDFFDEQQQAEALAKQKSMDEMLKQFQAGSFTTTTTAPAPKVTPTPIATAPTAKEPTPVFSEGGEQRAALVGDQVTQNLRDPQIPAKAVQTATKLRETPGQFIGEKQVQTGTMTIPRGFRGSREVPIFGTERDTSQFDQKEQADLQAAQAGVQQQGGPDNVQANLVDPAFVGSGALVEAAQGTIPNEITTSGRLTELLSSGAEDGIPAFAQPALAKVDRMLAARGMSRTSIGADQLSNMLIQAAIPLAQADSAALVQNFSQNLSNEQQAAMANAGFQQQALLSDQASANAAAQFNSSSQAQTDQFMASLKSTIEKSNADRITATSQFNTGQANAVGQFNSQLVFNRDQFNAKNALAIEQSNVSWRREMNKINTQSQNAVNQANAMNAFNMSNQALTFMWQEMRDAAKW
ncbi:MAG: hypothetical protein V3S69_01200, partial [Dehalococcoidales bacterium]